MTCRLQTVDEKILRKGLEFRADLERDANMRHVIFGIHPCAIMTKLNQDAHVAKNPYSDSDAEEAPARSRRKRVLKDHLPHWRKKSKLVVCLRIPIRRSLFNGSWRIEIERVSGTHRKILRRYLPPNQNSGKKRAISLSKKDLSSAEMGTSRRSRTSVTVVTSNGEVQTTEEAQVYVHDLGLFATVQLLEETPAVSHPLPQAVRLQHREQQDMTSRESSEIRIDPTVSGSRNRIRPNVQSDSKVLVNQNGTHPDTTRKLWETEAEQILTGWRWIINREMFSEWLQNFAENLEDPETLVSAQISDQGSDSECSTRVVVNSKLRKHGIYTHFPKDRSCDKSLRTKFTRSLFRRRVGEGSTPLEEMFGGLTTADHKILDEEGESRNNHRYAVVVQDLATQWNQFYQCITKTSQETEKSLQKFLEPSQKPKSYFSDNYWNVANPVKNVHGII